MRLTGFDGIDIKKLFNHYFTIRRLSNTATPKKKAILSLLKRILFSYTTINVERYREGAAIAFMNRDFNCRPDIARLMSNVMSTIENGNYDIIRWQKNPHFSALRTVSYTFYAFLWYIQLVRSQMFSFTESLSVIRMLMEFKDMAFDLRSKDLCKKYQLCVFCYDAETYQNFLSQYMQKMGCKTATLQHGVMLAPRKAASQNVDFAGIEFASFVSTYFLAWNDFTKKEAIKAGVEEDRIRILGIAKCIGDSPLNIDRKRKVIGVILDGEFEKRNNIPMIEMTNRLAQELGYTYILRYHPNFSGNEYEHEMNHQYGETCHKNVPLKEFLSDVGFCILANSTVLFELEYYGVPYLRYSTNDDFDKFKDYGGYTFHNYEGLIKNVKGGLFNGILKEDDNDELISRYRSFFMLFNNKR